MYRTNTCGELRLSDNGKKVTLAGWVQRVRKMGGMTFVDLRDRYGLTQLVFNESDHKELCDQANRLGREFCIQAEGTVSERQSKNANLPTGDIEIIADKLTILSESLTPPFTIEDLRKLKGNDYADYGSMSTRVNTDTHYDYYWGDYAVSSEKDRLMNQHTDRTLKGVATVKVGAEVKPIPEMAIRAGYNFTTIPEYSGMTTLHDNINAFSVGLGYSSKGSFFADLAARLTTFADEYISPYADYLSDYASPMILNKRERYDITATIGWRF